MKDESEPPIPNAERRTPNAEGRSTPTHPSTRSAGTRHTPTHASRDWLLARTSGRGADRGIEAVGRPEAWVEAISLVRKGGTVNLFGGCPAGTSIPIDTARLHYEALTLLGTFHHTPAAIREALCLLAEGQVPAETLIQDRARLEELPELLPRLSAGGGPLKVAIAPGPIAERLLENEARPGS